MLVHGRDFKPAEEAHRSICAEALRAGVQRDFPDLTGRFDDCKVDLACYGDLTNALLQGAGDHYDADLDIGDRRNALAELERIPARKGFGVRQYDRVPGKTAHKEATADVFAPVLGGVGLWMPLYRKLSPDFAEYLEGESDYAEAVRERLR